MANLPDLVAKLKLDTSDVARAGAEIAAFGTATKAGLGGSSGEIDKATSSVNKLEQALTPAGQAFVKFGDDGEIASTRISSTSAKSRADLDNLAARARAFGDGLDADFKKGLNAVISLDQEGGAALKSVSSTTEQAGFSFTQLGGKISTVFSSISEAVVPTLVGLALVLSPIIELLATFTVGLGAALTVATIGAGAFGALAAGMVLLADKTGQVNEPMQALEGHVTGVADALGKQAAPAAAQILQFVNDLLDPVGTLASQTIAWAEANGRLAAALGIAQDFANSLFDVLANQLGPEIGGILDEWLARGPEWEALWSSTLNFVAGAISGLLENLLKLSDWFIENLPTIGPETQAVFDGLGSAIQALGTAIAALLIPTFDLMKGHETEIAFAFEGLIILLGAVVLGFAAVAFAVASVGAGIASVLEPIGHLIDNLRGVQTGHQQAASAAQQHGSALSGLITFLQGSTTALNNQSTALQNVLTAEEALLGDTNSLAQAQDNLTQQVKSGTATHDQLQASLIQVAAAQEKQTEDTQTAAGVTVDAKLKADDYADSLDYAAAQAAKIGDSLDAAQFTARAEEIRGEAASIGAAIAAIPSEKIINIVTQSDVAIGSPTGHATGGPVVPGRVYLVGEQGPELLTIGATGSGYVYPNRSTETQSVLQSATGPQDPRPTTMIQLLSDQNQLLRAWLQTMMATPQPVGRFPYAGRAY